jgi:hypothetical protein
MQKYINTISAVGILVCEGIIGPVVSVLALIWFIRDIFLLKFTVPK